VVRFKEQIKDKIVNTEVGSLF